MRRSVSTASCSAHSRGLSRLGIVLFCVAIQGPLSANGPMITEFVSRNVSTLADEDGDFPDWIEIYNGGNNAVNLGRWSLTDDADELTKWTFPPMILESGEFLVVFASDKDRRDPQGELHTNFRLSAGGESLFLVNPLQEVVEPSFESFPEQIEDASYGVNMLLDSKPLIEEGATVKYLVPDNNDLELTWTELGFDDSSWASGPTPIGFDVKDVPTYDDLIATDVADLMSGINSSIYLRMTFNLEEADLGRFFRLRARFEDGVFVFINGEQVGASENVRRIRYNASASPARTAAEALELELIPLFPPEMLNIGENVLAIQLANDNRRDEDALCSLELSVFDITAVEATNFTFFANPSPGRPNSDGRQGIAPQPEFSHDGGTFSSPISLTLSAPDPAAEIRFTTDGKLPTLASDLYTGPIEVDSTMMIKARTFLPEFVPSAADFRSFTALSNGFKVDSNLPVFVVNVNSGIAGSFTPMHMTVFEPGENGRSSSDDLPHFMDAGVIKTRGSSTGGRAKASYSLEIQDGYGDDKDVEILEFPSESDYILYGAYNFDRAHVRNAFMYEVSNDVGRYAVRTRFCELYVSRNTRSLSNADYRGVYTFMEKIKRGEDRVDVERLGPEDNAEPEVAGGYILKIDRLDPGDRGFSAPGFGSMGWVYPKEADVTPEQQTWLTGYLQEMNASFTLPDADDPNLDYRQYVDELSWIDHHLLNELTKNPDALRLSTYLFKTREGRLENGPIWDFDRTMGCDDDSRAQNPVGWMGPHASALWGRLLSRPAFLRRYKSRWQELRSDLLATDRLLGIVDRMGAEIGESGGRDAAKWRQVANQRGFENEIGQLKTWLDRRLAWMDTQLIVEPAFSHAPGQVDPGTVVTLEVPIGEIFYTIDGSDPMSRNEPTEQAIAYTDAGIEITGSVKIRAAARISDRLWSGTVEAIYFTTRPTLAVTEIMYNPSDGDAEFLELFNFGDAPIPMAGLEIEGRVDFIFTEEHVIPPRGYLVLTDDPQLFRARYGDETRLDGEFDGRLSNARMEVRLVGPIGEPFLVFSYTDDWYPDTTDGQGYSLVLIDPTSDPSTWNEGSAWRESAEPGGTPGTSEEGEAPGLQRPGDANQDGLLNVTDAVRLLGHLFGGASATPCGTDEGNVRLLDVNGDGALNVADAVHELGFLFQGGAPPTLGRDCVPIAGCPDACSG